MKDLASHILDIVQNSVRAEARRIEIKICEDPRKDVFDLLIKDDGCGMDAETLQRIWDPFFTSRTVRKVGLGIPLLQQNAARTGGEVRITSAPHQGTTVRARFGHSHLDRPPSGDIGDTLLLLAIAHPSIHFRYEHTAPRGTCLFDTTEIEAVLDGVPLKHPDIFPAIHRLITDQLKAIQADNCPD